MGMEAGVIGVVGEETGEVGKEAVGVRGGVERKGVREIVGLTGLDMVSMTGGRRDG